MDHNIQLQEEIIKHGENHPLIEYYGKTMTTQCDNGYFPNEDFTIGDKLVFELILECNSNKVLSWLREKIYTNEGITKCFTFVLEKFDDIYNNMINIIPKMFKKLQKKDKINEVDTNYNQDDDYDIGYVLHFDLNFDDVYNFSEIWAINITKKGRAGPAGSLYDHPSILLNSVPNQKTIYEQGIEGFVGLVMLYIINSNILFEDNIVKTLQEIILDKVVDDVKKFTKDIHYVVKYYPTYDDNCPSAINLILDKWIEFLKYKIKPFDQNEAFLEYIFTQASKKSLEKEFLTNKFYKNIETTFLHRETKFIFRWKSRVSKYSKFKILDNYNNNNLDDIIKKFHKQNSIDQWIKLFEDFKKLDFKTKQKILFSLDANITQTFFGFNSGKQILVQSKYIEYCNLDPYEPFIKSVAVLNEDGRYKTVYKDPIFE